MIKPWYLMDRTKETECFTTTLDHAELIPMSRSRRLQLDRGGPDQRDLAEQAALVPWGCETTSPEPASPVLQLEIHQTINTSNTGYLVPPTWQIIHETARRPGATGGGTGAKASILSRLRRGQSGRRMARRLFLPGACNFVVAGPARTPAMRESLHIRNARRRASRSAPFLVSSSPFLQLKLYLLFLLFLVGSSLFPIPSPCSSHALLSRRTELPFILGVFDKAIPPPTLSQRNTFRFFQYAFFRCFDCPFGPFPSGPGQAHPSPRGGSVDRVLRCS
jgi:hypothetical protein